MGYCGVLGAPVRYCGVADSEEHPEVREVLSLALQLLEGWQLDPLMHRCALGGGSWTL